MGVVLGAFLRCHRCVTYLHDRWNDWRYTNDSDFGELEYIPQHPQVPNRHIHSAVIDKNVSEIKRILAESEASRTSVNTAGETALHLACRLGYHNIVDVLLESGCPADQKTDIGTPLHCVLKAISSNYLDNVEGVVIIEKLVLRDCNIDASDRGQRTPLFCSSEFGNYECMKILLDLGASVNCLDSNLFSPLYMSCIRGDLVCVNLLLKQRPRIDVNLQDSTGRSPLLASLISITNTFKYERMSNDIYNIGHQAEELLVINRCNRIAIVESLLRAEADANVVDNHGRNALVVAFVMLELDIQYNTASHNNITFDDLSRCAAGIPKETRESIYAPLVRLLVLSGARFPNGWEKDYNKSPDWIRTLYEETQSARDQNLIQHPAKLVHLCRLCIRAHMANVCRLQHMENIPLPDRLIHYLHVNYL